MSDDSKIVGRFVPPPGVATSVEELRERLKHLEVEMQPMVADTWADQRVLELESALRDVLGVIDPREHRSPAQQILIGQARQVLEGAR